jgi:hypothetical protein
MRNIKSDVLAVNEGIVVGHSNSWSRLITLLVTTNTNETTVHGAVRESTVLLFFFSFFASRSVRLHQSGRQADMWAT